MNIPKIFSIGEVAKLCGVSTTTIINWEGQGVIPKARRTFVNKRRIWTESQVEEIWNYRQENYGKV